LPSAASTADDRNVGEGMLPLRASLFRRLPPGSTARIAEEDLKLRGEGDVLGVRQSGLPGYHIARSDVHAQLITQARDQALRASRTTL
jgi:hypothetical protein